MIFCTQRAETFVQLRSSSEFLWGRSKGPSQDGSYLERWQRPRVPRQPTLLFVRKQLKSQRGPPRLLQAEGHSEILPNRQWIKGVAYFLGLILWPIRWSLWECAALLGAPLKKIPDPREGRHEGQGPHVLDSGRWSRHRVRGLPLHPGGRPFPQEVNPWTTRKKGRRWPSCRRPPISIEIGNLVVV